MAECKGTKENHCCWLRGQVCPHFRTDVAGREIACGLLVELGSWGSVYEDDRWKQDVKPTLDTTDLTWCHEWPQPGTLCRACGVEG